MAVTVGYYRSGVDHYSIKVRFGVPLTHLPLADIGAPKPHFKMTEFSFRIVGSTVFLHLSVLALSIVVFLSINLQPFLAP